MVTGCDNFYKSCAHTLLTRNIKSCGGTREHGKKPSNKSQEEGFIFASRSVNTGQNVTNLQ